jgi:hypothetical protein
VSRGKKTDPSDSGILFFPLDYCFFFLRWTFAVLCFEMAAGQPPFSGKDHIQLYEYVSNKYFILKKRNFL